jgi:N-acetylmuramoyl-L-alanine amidase
MGIRVKNKKRFGFWCIVFVLMLLNLIFAASKRLGGDKVISEDKKSTVSQVAMAADEDGSVAFSESKYFKRYIIDCRNNIGQVKWEESKEYIDIVLKKNEIAKLNLKGENTLEAKDIYYDNSKENIIIKVKKAFNENNLVYVDSNNNKKIVVLIAKEENPFKHTVVLDAGHGGIDKGANYGSIYEKNITLKIVNYAEDELVFNGIKVMKTRDEDKFLELDEISNISNRASADLFISVHINSNKVSMYKGITTYYYDSNGYQKDERIKLAQTLQKELVKSDNWEDRGIAKDNLAVLRNSKIPCVLLELGFLSNSQDRDKLMKDEVLKNFSSNIAKGIVNYFSGE